jgi:hypothetical protein
MQIRRTAAALTSAAALTVSGVALATPAQAQPVITGGLVNVVVTDLIDGDVASNNNVGIGVAAGVAANVCGVQAQVGVIAEQLARGGNVRCVAEAGDQQVDISQRSRRS